MKRIKNGLGIVLCLCALLVIAAFFARDFVLYDFHLEPSYYTYQRTDQARPEGVASDVWFTYGADRALQYGISDGIRETAIQLYAKTTDSAQAIAASDMEPIRQDFYGNFIAALPAWEWDLDGDGATETVYDFARADLGPHAFDPFPVCFHLPEIPFELALFNRNSIQIYWNGEPLSGGEITITAHDGAVRRCETGDDGRIAVLSARDIRSGFAAANSPDGDSVYRMYYALEDYPYFSLRFFKAHLPLLLVLGLSAAGILLVQLLRPIGDAGTPLTAFTAGSAPACTETRRSVRKPAPITYWCAGCFWCWPYSCGPTPEGSSGRDRG